MLSPVLYIDPSFFDDISLLEDLELGGSCLIDMRFNASISRTAVNSSSYSGIDVDVTVKRFEVEGFFKAPDPFSINLTLDIPAVGESVTLALSDATFDTKLFANLSSPVNLSDLFSENQNESVLEYGGSLNASFPLSVGVAGANIYVGLDISDDDLFNDPSPTIEYKLDLCEVANTSKSLFEELKNQILDVIKGELVAGNIVCYLFGMLLTHMVVDCIKYKDPLDSLDIGLDIDKITQPLVQKVNDTLSDFQQDINEKLDSIAGCDRRLEEGEGSSLVSVIRDAIASVNNSTLKDLGIEISADVAPYFDKDALSVGVKINLTATIEQSVAEVIDFVGDFFQNATQPEAEDPDFGNLGVGSSDGSTIGIDLVQLQEDTLISAGFDVKFDLGFHLGDIKSLITDPGSIVPALEKGLVLGIEKWGAFATLVVDPINIDIALFGQNQSIIDSSIAISAELRSKDEFSASVKDMMEGNSNASVLVPELTVPLSTELIFNLTVYDGLYFSPIMKLKSEDLVKASFTFDFDVDLDTLLNSTTFGSNTLVSLL